MNTHVRDNLDWLKTPVDSGRVQFASDFATASTSYVDVTDVTTTMTTRGGGLDIYFRASLSNNSPSSTQFQAVIDGSSVDLLGQHFINSTSVSFVMLWSHIAAIAAGSHTIKIQAKVTAGTTTIRGTTGANTDPLFYVREIGD
jgi:hypothetical protein